MKKILFVWGFFWGVVAWVPLFCYCLLYAIAELRISAFREMLEEFI